MANIKQFQYLHAIQQQVAQFFVDLNTEKSKRLRLRTTIRQIEDQLTQLHRQVIEPLPSSLAVPFTIDPPNSAAFQDSNVLGNIQISKPRVTITLKRTSSTTFRSQLTEPLRTPPSAETTSGPPSDLEAPVKQLEEEITKASNSRETIASIYRPQYLPFFMIEFDPWSLQAQTLSCGN